MRSFKKGNTICGVYINSIKGKDQKTKPQGKNPFDDLAVTISDSGSTVTMHELKDGKWQLYTEVDGRAAYQREPVAYKYRGNFYRLSDLQPTFDWVKDNGYKNFSNWV